MTQAWRNFYQHILIMFGLLALLIGVTSHSMSGQQEEIWSLEKPADQTDSWLPMCDGPAEFLCPVDQS